MDDIVLIEESRVAVNFKLEVWRQTLEIKDFCSRVRQIICIEILEVKAGDFIPQFSN